MKKLRLLAGCVFMATMITWLGACEGPQGPAGPAGPAGQQGPTGTTGPAGPAGTANVIYSNWAAAGAWNRTNVFGVDKFYIDITAARLSQEILDRGVVLVYTKLSVENNQVRQLPVSIISQFTEELIDYSLRVGVVRVWSTPVRPPVTPEANTQFRYVLIPGGQASRMNFEKLTYDEAKAMFNLPD
ncbi:hypothetical protein [Telluribacter humicola]|uniref:hypothetical protein n=1 Tax=Telluribacter humicola TaxID=1720261 RepID=UPI001A95B2FB|nr:hypothetical protein [Telluribacter humicola]